MMYMLEEYALVAGIVFGFAGIFMLVFVALREAREYARARLAMRRIAAPVHNMTIDRKAA